MLELVPDMTHSPPSLVEISHNDMPRVRTCTIEKSKSLPQRQHVIYTANALTLLEGDNAICRQIVAQCVPEKYHTLFSCITVRRINLFQ